MPHLSSLFGAFRLLGCFFLLANTNNSAVSYGVWYFWGYLIPWDFCSVSYRGRLASQSSKGALRQRCCSWQWEVPWGPLKCSFQIDDCSICSQDPDPSLWRNRDLNLVLLVSKAMLQLFYTELVLITTLQWLGRWKRYGCHLRWAVRTKLSILWKAHVKWWLSAIGNCCKIGSQITLPGAPFSWLSMVRACLGQKQLDSLWGCAWDIHSYTYWPFKSQVLFLLLLLTSALFVQLSHRAFFLSSLYVQALGKKVFFWGG